MKGWDHVTVSPQGKIQKGKRSKYRAKPCMVHGRRFDSQAEAKRYQQLLLQGVWLGQIRNLELQPSFPLHGANGEQIGVYRADFRYENRVLARYFNDDPTWVDVVEDVKGVRTALYRWKKKHFEAEYGITIRETH